MKTNIIQGVSLKTWWLLFFVAAVSFVFTLNLSHIGEEGVYTISSFEMWYNKHYLYPLIYGGGYGRPPLMNWFILAITKIVGWSQLLLASRLVTAFATIGTGLILAWLTKNIFNDKQFAVFAAVAYLTTDALFYHGWLAYSDPLFAFFVFAAIACLWVATIKESFIFLTIAGLALTGAFLTKAITAYAFYAVAVSILLLGNKRKFFLHPLSILLHLIFFSVPFWWAIITNSVNGSSLVHDIWYWGWQSGKEIKITTYLANLVIFLFEVFVRMLPISLLAAYCLLISNDKPDIKSKTVIKGLILFIIISFLPYWLATKHSIRYVMPLYPFIALLCSYIVWHTNQRFIRVSLIGFIIAIVIKYCSVIFWWPYYQTYYRGDYVKVAQDVVQQTYNYTLYTGDDPGSAEHCVFYSVNILRYPLTPIKTIGSKPTTLNDYFVFTTDEKFNSGKIVKEYILGKLKKKIYLLCYGKACRIEGNGK